ncbi:MAG: ferrochelatase [Actinobacteria bacterium]|jgi:ferrochelatase|nr:ferrochelatase [Actinomycetota bacterium]MCL6094696.1 ferrochelatase [Actinomycetota bacterium]
MAHGTPESTGDIERFYTHIRKGRKPSQTELDELTSRYNAIGGLSPLKQLTWDQVEGVQRALDKIRPATYRTFLATKHSYPTFADAVSAISRDDLDGIVGLVLAPHYSMLSVEEYYTEAKKALEEEGVSLPFLMIPSWHMNGGFLEALAQRLRKAYSMALAKGSDSSPIVIFTAHSLPVDLLSDDDPYPSQVNETASWLANELAIENWYLAWQSAGKAGTFNWLKPTLEEVLEHIADQRVSSVVICPIGFVADHLEILYDIDIVATNLAERSGIHLLRTDSLNADPTFTYALATMVDDIVSQSFKGIGRQRLLEYPEPSQSSSLSPPINTPWWSGKVPKEREQ